MTNNWVDLAYSSMFFVCGANPVENHPASIAHLNAARYDTNGRGRNAALVVVDPRQTRTARMISAPGIIAAATGNDMRKHDRYVRIRPGTNIAFINGVLNSIITWMYANPTATASQNFFAWHNTTNNLDAVTGISTSGSAGRTFIDDAQGVTNRTLGKDQLVGAQYSHDGGTTWVAAPLATGWPKYCDSRLKVDTATGDYARAKLRVPTGVVNQYWTFSNMPVFAADVDDSATVFQKLKTHVSKYTAAAVSQICGCTEADIAAVRDAFIANSRFSSSDFGAAAQTQNAAGYRASTIMYAMGATQFTSGSQGVRSYAVIQTLMGNMGRCGGGINALRGIHNVQGSTDMGVLFDLIPAYSGNPGVGQTYEDYSNKLFGNRVLGTTTRSAYVEGDIAWQQRGFYNMTREFFGSRAITSTAADHAAFDRLYDCWPKGNGVQHIEAFRRMDPAWAASKSVQRIAACVVWGQNPAVTEPNQAAVRKGLESLDLLVCTDLFANETAQCKRKADGVTYLLPACSHVEEAGSATSSGRWIHWRDRARAPRGNSKTDLELLLRFAKSLSAAGAFDHIKAQWVGTDIAGTDAYTTLYGEKYGWDGTGSMEAVSGPAFETGVTLRASEYVAEQIYKEMCAPLDGYNAVSGNAGFKSGQKGTMWIYSGARVAHGGAYNPDSKTDAYPAIYGLTGTGANSAFVVKDGAGAVIAAAEYTMDTNLGTIQRSSATSAIADGATVYVDYKWGLVGTAAAGWTVVTGEAAVLNGTAAATLAYKSSATIPEWAKWGVANRAKSRTGAAENAGASGQFPRYGWAWLLNRRVMYNNGELTGDVADVFVAPGFLARLWCIASSNTLADWSWLYRTYNQLADKPDTNTAAGQVHEFSGRFPGFTEPYESPYDGSGTLPNLVSTWGRNTSGGTASNLVFADSPRGTAANFPLVLTTIRCVEHFQGGPITRNNASNVDLEPEPWVEINSVDAAKYGIADGDYVNVITARGNSVSDQNARTAGGAIAPVAGWAKGFKARVGAGTLANQRVAPGTVAIPWHWGDRGLGVGSRANDLCIDAWDANTRIPEYKACLCKIQKVNP